MKEFGVKRKNEERRDGGCAVVYCPESKKFAVGADHDGGILRLFSGGVSDGEDIQTGILREVEEESGLHEFKHVEVIGEAMCHYHNVLKNVNRVARATCLLVILESRSCKEVQLEEHETFSLDWVNRGALLNNWKDFNGENDFDHWFYFFEIAEEKLVEKGYAL